MKPSGKTLFQLSLVFLSLLIICLDAEIAREMALERSVGGPVIICLLFQLPTFTPRSLGGLSSANDRAGAAFTVGPLGEMAIAYA